MPGVRVTRMRCVKTVNELEFLNKNNRVLQVLFWRHSELIKPVPGKMFTTNLHSIVILTRYEEGSYRSEIEILRFLRMTVCANS
jgi:hypothetical protein